MNYDLFHRIHKRILKVFELSQQAVSLWISLLNLAPSDMDSRSKSSLPTHISKLLRFDQCNPRSITNLFNDKQTSESYERIYETINRIYEIPIRKPRWLFHYRLPYSHSSLLRKINMWGASLLFQFSIRNLCYVSIYDGVMLTFILSYKCYSQLIFEKNGIEWRVRKRSNKRKKNERKSSRSGVRFDRPFLLFFN